MFLLWVATEAANALVPRLLGTPRSRIENSLRADAWSEESKRF